ncbi:cytochrome P450 [Punctularia strigosozonata HHB-11173 SS5]|uniref:cytochrome P450 n=1 Tax=Punctularia strigosozonata (strain HHB-11173) TaxID=741275 RepID=UPI0004417A1D|nr:cytochrome P450 [Punctularia strigosozonata HHB-11173 SS5]EIN08748.1 cytochrome P450 [Punctularia strigosozonata HHB-11173 SS5]
MTDKTLSLLAALLCVGLPAIWLRRWSEQRQRFLPPGPKGYPLIGNLFDVPDHHEWETYSKWGEEHGDIVYVKVLGQANVILNSAEAMHHILEKSSAASSDRPKMTLLNDLIGFSWHFAFMPYGERWRQLRRIFHENFNPTAVTSFFPIQRRQRIDLLRRLHRSPHRFVEHFQHYVGATIMEAVYGIKVAAEGDPYIETANVVAEAVTEAGTTTLNLVDSFPIMKYIPAWFPGARFKAKANEWRQYGLMMITKPFERAKRETVEGTAQPSFTSENLEALWSTCSHDDPRVLREEELIRDAGAAAYEAGSGTTAEAMHTFTLAMVLYPDVQRKAQEEIDAVVGPHRLPDFNDRPHLPYLDCIITEIHRWYTVQPLAQQHRASEDIPYRGYIIPKGATITPNVWSVLRDERVYGSDVGTFNPERWLRPGLENAPRGFPSGTFGYGRRVCPGRYMADNSLFIATSSILATYNIKRAVDEKGQEIPVHERFTDGFMIHPQPFRCTIELRSAQAERLIYDDSDIG